MDIMNNFKNKPTDVKIKFHYDYERESQKQY